MADTPVSLDKWRDYFSGVNSDIFDIIEHAIMVAASDCPYDFKLKRDRIAEMLFTCKVAKCFGCNRIELSVPNGDCLDKIDDDDEDGKCKSGVEAGGSKDTKESNSCRDDLREGMEMNVNQVSNHSYDYAEALTDEIEESSQFLEEVWRIKEIVDHSEEKSDELLFDSLRRLQLMPLTVEILKTTEIGKSVNSVRRRGSKEIRNLVRTLIEDWKLMVDEWVSATTAFAGTETTTESAKTSEIEEEEGLPSPPLDEGAFFATPTSMELSQFFDGMDDDGNPRNSGEFVKNRENGRMRIPERRVVPGHKFDSWNDSRTQESTLKKQAPSCKPNGPGRPKPPTGDSSTKRPKPAAQPNNVTKVQRNETVQKKPAPAPHQREKLNCDNKASVGMKLEAAKRKLQERYQEAENAKKQRTIQVVELRDLPKQSREQQMRSGFNHRRWSQGQR